MPHFKPDYPSSIEAGGVSLDILVNMATANNAGDNDSNKNFVMQTGVLSSTLEHATPEQMFNTDPENPPNAFSAVKALQIASGEGQRIYQITQANISSVMPNLNLDAATETEIQQAVNVGKEVITHTDLVSVPGYSGAGYIILDPVTGEGAYRISGGGNGAFFTLLAVASAALLALLVVPTGIVVGTAFIAALVALEVFTVGLALYFGIDFKTFANEIQFIGVAASMPLFGGLIRVAQGLGATALAQKIAATAIGLEIMFGVYFLGKDG